MPTARGTIVQIAGAGEGLYAGTDVTLRQLIYSDSALTVLVNAPAVPTVLVTLPDDSTATPTATNPETGTYDVVIATPQVGFYVVRLTFTDSGGKNAVYYYTFRAG